MPRFSKAPGFYHDTRDTFGRAILYGCRYEFCRNKDDGQVNMTGDGACGRIAGNTLDFLVAGIDRINISLIAYDEILKDSIPTLERVRRCADNSDSVRVKKEIYGSSSSENYGLLMVTSRYFLPHALASFSSGKKMSMWFPLMALPVSCTSPQP